MERRFSLAKRKCNLGLVSAKLKDTAFHCIAMSIVVLNLRKLALSFGSVIKILLEWLRFDKIDVIQQTLFTTQTQNCPKFLKMLEILAGKCYNEPIIGYKILQKRS